MRTGGRDRGTDAFRSVFANSEPGMARFSAVGKAYRRFALDHSDSFRLIFGDLDATYKLGDEQVDHGSRIFDLVVYAESALQYAFGRLFAGVQIADPA